MCFAGVSAHMCLRLCERKEMEQGCGGVRRGGNLWQALSVDLRPTEMRRMTSPHNPVMRVCV